ncbi:MAG: alpha/beta fold hydrolase [Verrucomicrobia bacterium]|nr:alpha/beta fold hydrolase [Verrucomicrobiota bacterium]
MPVVASRFLPPLFLRNGHVQTILPTLLRRQYPIVFRRERLELGDGDFLDLDWATGGADRLGILSHGLEGTSEDGSIRGMATLLQKAGWDVLAWNFRGCGREKNRLLRFYHSGETEDLAAVVALAAARYSQIVLIGLSLGGNVTLKYLGEGACHPAVIAGIAISAPIDLAASVHAIDHRLSNLFYLRRFLRRLVPKIEEKALRFPQRLDVRRSRQIRTLAEFDDLYTAPIHGFRDAADYWEKSSSKQFLGRIDVPTLLLNARDDPFLTAESLPYAVAEKNAHLFFEAPEWGGHVGFIDSIRTIRPWYESRSAEFLGDLLLALPPVEG